MLPHASQILGLTVDGTDAAETANVMDTLGQHCHQLTFVEFDGCDGIPAALAKLSDQPNCCSRLRFLELRPAEAADDATIGEHVRVLRQSRPPLIVCPHEEEDYHCVVWQKVM